MAIPIFGLLLAGVLVQPQDWMRTGHKAMDEGRTQDASVAFQRALEEGARLGLADGSLVRIRVALATAYMEGHNLRAAASVLRQASSDQPMARAELLNARGSLSLLENRVSEAARELNEALTLARTIPDPGTLLPSVLDNLAGAELREGLYSKALGHSEECLKLIEKSFSQGHPSVIRARASMAAVEYLAGQPQRAQATMQVAITSAEDTLGFAHPLVADLLDSDAVILEHLHKKKEAKAARERARLIRGGRRDAPGKRMTWDVREALLPAEVLTR